MYWLTGRFVSSLSVHVPLLCVKDENSVSSSVFSIVCCGERPTRSPFLSSSWLYGLLVGQLRLKKHYPWQKNGEQTNSNFLENLVMLRLKWVSMNEQFALNYPPPVLPAYRSNQIIDAIFSFLIDIP